MLMAAQSDDLVPVPYVTQEYLEARLKAAGTAAVSIPERTKPSGYRTAWPEVVRSVNEAYGWHAEQSRFPVPSAKAICDMYEVFDWLLLLEGLDRSIVSARMLWHPLKDRHIVSWNRLARFTGLHKNTVKRRYDVALDRMIPLINNTNNSTDLS